MRFTIITPRSVAIIVFLIVRLTIISIGSRTSTPSITVSGNNVYLVWHDGSSGLGISRLGETHFRTSANGRANFGPTENLSNSGRASGLPSIAATSVP